MIKEYAILEKNNRKGVGSSRFFVIFADGMKPSDIFYQFSWLLTTLIRYPRMTLEEINERWVTDRVNEGNPLPRSTFNRHRDSIFDLFGVVIECDRSTYQYYIANLSEIADGSIKRWLLSTMTVNMALSDSMTVKDRIILENVPAGEQYMPTIIKAMKLNRRVRIIYRRFGYEAYEKTVDPYTLRLFHQRWYMLVFTGHHMAIFALDRMLSLKMTDETFEMPKDFSPQAYFADYFGVLTDETPKSHVVLRAYGKMVNYLRTLPLHQSQRELQSADDHTDFALNLRPTADFIGELLSHDVGLEVLAPEDLRQRIGRLIGDMGKHYNG